MCTCIIREWLRKFNHLYENVYKIHIVGVYTSQSSKIYFQKICYFGEVMFILFLSLLVFSLCFNILIFLAQDLFNYRLRLLHDWHQLKIRKFLN